MPFYPEANSVANVIIGPVVSALDHVTGATGLLTGGNTVTALTGSTTASIVVTSSSAFAVGQYVEYGSGTAGNAAYKGYIATIPDGTHVTLSPAPSVAPVNSDTFSTSQFTILLSKNGGMPGIPAGLLSEIGGGDYSLAANATDANTLGTLRIQLALAPGITTIDPYNDSVQIVAFNPFSATNLGLTALPTANPAAAGGLHTVGTGSGQIQPDGAGNVLVSNGTGAGQISLTSGVVKANVTQIAGQTAVAAGAVTFPASVGSSSFAAGGSVVVEGYAAGEDPVSLLASDFATVNSTLATIEGHTANADSQSAALPSAAAIATAVGGRALETAPATGTWDEAMAAARAGQGLGKLTYAPPAGGGAGTGSEVIYAHDGATVLHTFSDVVVDVNGNVTNRS